MNAIGAQGAHGLTKDPRPRTQAGHTHKHTHVHRHKYSVRAGRAHGTQRTYFTLAYKALVLAAWGVQQGLESGT